MANFFYDAQIRRFLYQFARMFSNFEVEGGLDENGYPILVRVPIRYGDASRQAATILQENSASNLPCAPLMSFYIDSLKYDRPRMQEPHFIDKRHVKQREWDETSQTYEQAQGNAFDISCSQLRHYVHPDLSTLEISLEFHYKEASISQH